MRTASIGLGGISPRKASRTLASRPRPATGKDCDAWAAPASDLERTANMYLITGITGKVGGAAAQRLLEMGKQVRALVRDQAKATAWSAKGVELVKGEWEDPAVMTRALDRVEGVYLMMPPIQTPSRDFREAKAVVASYKEALSKSRPPKLVALSSLGSEKTSGLGLIHSTHLLEEGLGN